MKPHFVAWALLALSYLPNFRAQIFTNGQNASAVLGQPDFTSFSSSNIPNRFSQPTGVTMDPTNGDIYVADRFNNRVLRFSSAAAAQIGANPINVFGQPNFTGNILNQNMGAANPTSKTLYDPRSVFVDSNGRLWVTDAGNNRVLRFDLVSALGIDPAADAVYGQPNFTTGPAGMTADNRMSQPYGVYIDSLDNLWVSDRVNNRVLRFNAVTSKANVNAQADFVLGQTNFTNNGSGNSDTDMSGPCGIIVDAGDRLWVADTGNNRVLLFKHASNPSFQASGLLGQPNGYANSGAGSTSAEFDQPYGVYADSNGNLWVSEFGNRRIVRFNDVANKPSSGATADIVLGQTGFFAPPAITTTINSLSGPALISGGPGGSILIADFTASRVLRFNPLAPPTPKPPQVSLIGSTKRTTTQAQISIKGSSIDSDGSVVVVKASLGKSSKNAKGTLAWRYTAKNLKKGKNLIKIQAFDNQGLISNIVRVTVTRK